MALLWLILKKYTILEDFFLLNSVCYHDDVMTTLKCDWSNLEILISGWYCKLTLSCFSFTIYQQCHTDIKGDDTPVSLQYQNVHWVDKSLPVTKLWRFQKLRQSSLVIFGRQRKSIYFTTIHIFVYKLVYF